MAYNYSPWFLTQNEAAVRWLVKLARDAEIGSARFDQPDEARAYRLKILSLLACLARNQPDMAWVKNRLRTWIHYDGRYTVFVGVPPAHLKLRGPKPVAIQPGISSGQILNIPLFSKANANKLQYQLGATLLPESKVVEIVIQQIETEPEQLPEWRQAIYGLVQEQFEVISEEPFIMRRKPKNASANIAPPSV